MSKEKLYHHHLVSGEIYFLKDEETIQVKRLNAILRTKENRVTGDDIGKAQQNLQLLFRHGIPDPEIQIVDVYLQGISYLGYMTNAQFAPSSEEVH